MSGLGRARTNTKRMTKPGEKQETSSATKRIITEPNEPMPSRNSTPAQGACGLTQQAAAVSDEYRIWQPQFERFIENRFDLSGVEPKAFEFDYEFSEPRAHDLFIKSIDVSDKAQASMRFRIALQHHAFTFNLGPITLCKLWISSSRNIKTCVAFVSFEKRDLHRQIAASLNGAKWGNYWLKAGINPFRTQPHHIGQLPNDRNNDAKKEIRERKLNDQMNAHES